MLKNGIPVAIVGEPNVEITLLNALLNDNRAIVSEIAGTTRDTIEDEIIEGLSFRFIDMLVFEILKTLLKLLVLKRLLRRLIKLKWYYIFLT